MTIREATLDDVPALVAMGRRFVGETSYHGWLVENVVQLEQLARRLIEDPAMMVFVAADRDGDVVGMLALATYLHPMSGESMAGELCWWMNPARRGAGVRLLRHAERWAQQRGVVQMQLTAPTPRIGAFYAAIGYRPIETTYQRRF